jgi:hypothetical protein
MAYVDITQFKDHDYSVPYKTFNDLKTDDNVYLIDLNNLEIITCNIIDCDVKEATYNIHDINRFEVKLTMIDPYDSDRKEYVSIYDGNQYIAGVNINYRAEYITTDKRIANTVSDLLKIRNNRQWSMFSKIFGNPIDNRYEHRDIKLC